MASRVGIGGGALAALMTIATASMAQTVYCGEGPIPDQPLTLRTPGSPDRTLPAVQLTVTPSRLTFFDTDKVFRPLDLVMEDGTRKTMFDGVVQAEVDFLVVEGASLDDRVFSLKRAKPGSPEWSAQETFYGSTEVQRWAVRIPNPPPERAKRLYAIEATQVGYAASLRIEFGKRSGATIPGKIHLCVPGNQIGLFDAVLKDPFEVVGRFTATVKD